MSKKLSLLNLKNCFYFFILSSPFLFLYLTLFILSMDVAPDRKDYINIMAFPFGGREEPLIHVYAYFSNILLANPFYQLLILQVLFVFLMLLLFFKKFDVKNINGLTKVFICLLVFLSVFSNMLGVQLRIGYATILFLFIVFFLNKKPGLYAIPFFILPCLMHSGLIVAVSLYYLFYFLKIDNLKKFSILFVFLIIFSSFIIKILPLFFEFFGVSNYYLMYLQDDLSLGRKIPFSVLFYIFVTFFLFLKYQKTNNIDFWYGVSGLVLVYTGFVLDFYVSFKMLVPVSAFLYIYTIYKWDFDTYSSYLILILILILTPFSFIMFMNQVGLL
ncbi:MULTISPECIES: EpsG family protein [Acinetobacter]|uniref:EpsG family protein n=1 Tax=Acinetobacter TaxID=469 RepID=UPI0021CDAEA0|nr:EpsG family protein [Acinetobacter lwoffii]MCU4438647.1 EpsG family protein [Acinetobacter lwoffii]